MKKRGFTLIELLAVIVILAIIALIATPIVMNLIENSKKGAAERSTENLEHSAEIYYYNKKLDGGFPGITFTCKNGSCSSNDETLEISGKAPEAGTVIINKDGTITLSSIVINGYTCYKENDSYKCEKANKASVSTTNGVLTLEESKTTTLSNYIIKGNSYQATRSGKNLFNIDNLEQTSHNGLNYEVVNGIVKINGTQTASFERAIPCNFILKANTTYSISANLTGTIIDGFPLFYFSKDKIPKVEDDIYINYTVPNKVDFSVTEDTEINYFIIQSSITGANWQNLELKIQVEEGSEATAYEPYGASPSSDYPSEIQSVGNLVTDGPNKGKYEIPIRLTGKNLFDISKYVNGAKELGAGTSISLIDNGMILSTIGYQENYTKTEIKTIDKTQYTFSADVNWENANNEKVSMSFVFYYDDGTESPFVIYKDTQKVNFTSDKGKTVVAISNGHWQYSGSIRLTNIQLEKNDIATSYESYNEEIKSIYMDEPLRCLGNVCDYIDYENGKIFRNIEVIDNSGTKTIENSFGVLTTPIEQQISLPVININKTVSNIFVETEIKPSEFIVDYYN